MTTDPANLTGRWFGRYDVPPFVDQEPVPFEVELLDEGGALSGTTSEPNTLRANLGPTLTARITGDRLGQDMRFTKVYDAFEQDPQIYEGQINSTFNRIDGTYHFAILPFVRCRFIMVRAVKATARQKAEMTQELEDALAR